MNQLVKVSATGASATHPSIRPSTRHIIYALSGVLDIQRGNRRDLIVKEFRYLQHEQY